MAKWTVDIIESERGWGSKVDDTYEWPEEEKVQAETFVMEFNKQNNLPYAPEIYWRAERPYLSEGKADPNKKPRRKPNA